MKVTSRRLIVVVLPLLMTTPLRAQSNGSLQGHVFDTSDAVIVGASLLVLLQSAVIAALLVQRTRRVRAQTALGESEERFRLIANSAKEAVTALQEGQQRYAAATAAGAVGVWDWNLETNEIYVDPTLKSILGFEDAEITTRADDWGSRVHPLDVAMVTAQAQACIDGRIDEYEVEHRMIHKDGSARWFLSRGSLVRRADGTPHHMVGTKVDITGRKIAETSVRENEAVLKATNREIQDLAGRLIVAQEVERARIARDLHDDLSQQLAGLSIALSGLKRRIGGLMGAGELQDDVSSLQRRAVGLAENIRHLSHDLHPSVLEHAGLVAALAAHCAEIERQQVVLVTFCAEGDFTATSPDTALCLYRVAQEALRNVVTHARARHAEVQLRRTGDFAELTIADDGRGFDVIRTNKSPQGLGLVSIGERVRLVGGTVSIVTELNNGTRLHVQVPANGGAAGVAAESASYEVSAG
jgi:PAS domain S-box-containing protein